MCLYMIVYAIACYCMLVYTSIFIVLYSIISSIVLFALTLKTYEISNSFRTRVFPYLYPLGVPSKYTKHISQIPPKRPGP